MIKNIRLLKELLGQGEWRYFIFLIFAAFVANILECVGISLIFPAVSVLLNPDFLQENEWGSLLGGMFSLKASKQLLVWILLLIGLCYFLKNVYLLWVSYIKNRFILKCQFALKKKILSGFFNAPYVKYMDCSTAELVQSVEADVDGCIIFMEKMLQICGELMMIGLLGVLMLAADVEVTIAVFVLCGGVFLLFACCFKPYAERKSIAYAEARKDFNKWLYQSVGNRKEIKAEQKEYFFLKNFNSLSEKACEIDAKVRFMQSLPKLIFEMCFVVCIIGVLIFFANTAEDMSEAVAVLSLFGIAVLRMLPSLLKLNQLFGSTFWHIPMLERTLKRFAEQKICLECVRNAEALPFENELQLLEISFSYPGAANRIFDKASLSIPAGGVIGICGLSGAGKTTLVDIIAGLLPVSEGEILVDGISLQEERLASWQAGVAYIPQNACLLDATIRENILFGDGDVKDEILWKVLSQAAADDFVRRLPDGLETPVGENGCRLSGGQSQRLVLARALYKKARLLILDETTSALDAETEQLILKAISRIGRSTTVILISHRLSALDVCDFVYRIENGKARRVTNERI